MLTNMKRRTALLASVAVLCATVAMVPNVASAAGSKVPNVGSTALSDPHTVPNNTTAMSACPGTSAPAAGFTDTTSTDVDCIKMFGITQGTSATTYEPNASVPRWQMALFLHRMFVPTGVAAAGATAVPAFTDTSGLDAEITAAISAIASHGVTVGTSATTFSPNDNVTREQMALFLYRLGRLVKPNDVASNAGTANGIFADGAAGADILTGTYQFTDITGATFEGMEAIIAMYNLGATGETCTTTTITAAAGGSCQTTYRPNDDITRAEMATMIKSVLDPSNARPAGVSIQNTGVVATGSNNTRISMRNADFTPLFNQSVDAFWYQVNDTSATTQAASVPFGALDGLCSASQVTGTSTRCTHDAGDSNTNALGNVAGPAVTITAPATGHAVAWTGDPGTFWINGTTTGFEWTASLPAAAAAGTFATAAASAWDKATAGNTCDFSSMGNVAAANGECAYQGTSRTLTTTMTAAVGAVKDGYTVKYVDKVVNYGGGTGLQTVSYVTTYSVTAGGAASYAVTCGADPKPLTNNADNDGATDIADYYESHEVTVSFMTAAGTTGIPTGGGAITPTGVSNLSCDDVARDYVGAGIGSESLAVNQNYAAVSTAGTLATITATATDQYGDGIAGVEARFAKTVIKNAASTAEATIAEAPQTTLLTGADGTAHLSAIVCDAASVGTSGIVKWSIKDPGGNANEMDDVAIGAGPGAATAEGQWIYCTKTAADAVSATTMRSNVTGVTHAVEIKFYLADKTTACDPDGGTYTITYNGEATDAIAHGADGAAVLSALHANDNVDADGFASATWADNTGTTGGAAGAGAKVTLVTKALSGNHTGLFSVTGTGLQDGGGAANQLCPDSSVVFNVTVQGLHQTTYDFVDNDPIAKKIFVKRTVQDRVNATGANVVITDYETFTYDDSDVFWVKNSNPALAVPGATMAEFEAAMAAVANLTSDMSVTYRTGATGTQVSAFNLTTG